MGGRPMGMGMPRPWSISRLITVWHDGILVRREGTVGSVLKTGGEGGVGCQASPKDREG